MYLAADSLTLVRDVSCPCSDVSIVHYNSITRAGTAWWSFTTGARAAAANRESSVWCCSCQMSGQLSHPRSSGRRYKINIRVPVKRRCGDLTAKSSCLPAARRKPPRPWTNHKLFVPSLVCIFSAARSFLDEDITCAASYG